VIWVLDWGHIRCCGNGYLWFRSYSGSLLANAPKVTKRSLPHHSVPRLGSACPHSGTAPRAAATARPWPVAAKSASLPIYPLHRAYLRPSWLTGPSDQNQKPDQKQRRSSVGAGLPAKKPRAPRSFRMPTSSLTTFASKLAPTNRSSRPVGRCAVAFDLDLDLRRPVKPRWPNAGSTERVNRQDAGLAATGQGRPVAAARAVIPERGHTEPRRGAEWWGKSVLLTFALFKSEPL